MSEKLGRALLDLDTDSMKNEFGTCEAELGVTGTRKCYNTQSTCQDLVNFEPGILTLALLAATGRPSPVRLRDPLDRARRRRHHRPAGEWSRSVRMNSNKRGPAR